MAQIEQYRQIIQTVVKRHAEYIPSHGKIETLPLCDTIKDNYLLIDLGWDRTGRVHAVVFHLRIHNQKIWVEYDGTEEGITQELLDLGIPKEDIVLGFYRPEYRELTGFTVA
ncbi:XisI protein [Lyngbya sp. PCC 8106]|uniref:XisI protein n=1 Tax=Lyngbya sp. (strain PCC 8106) TaxID=313612 RepID=UPI0000EAB2C4|nr:XisI protein [Lyngbya sp. PCC 8106]EAW33554.1 fdxN element excision controlling factor protein [Lyngbya sp. PCC 8106]